MKNRSGHTVGVQHSTSKQSTKTTQTITPDSTARTSRSLYAEARRYQSAARNMFEGRYDGIDENGRQWTVDELYAHSAQCRRAGDQAYASEKRTQAVLPMPGRLPVTRLVRGLPGQPVSVESALAEVATDTMVTAKGTITAVRYLDGRVFGRTMIVLTSDDGNSAHVLFTADSAYYAEPVLRKGSRIKLHGLVTRHIPGQPVGLEGLGVQVEVA